MMKSPLASLLMSAFVSLNFAFGESALDKEFINAVIQARRPFNTTGKLDGPIRTIDVNGDGLSDRLLPYDCEVRRQCLSALLVQQKDGRFEDEGDIEFQTGATVLLNRKHNGFFDILSYQPDGVSKGSLTRQEFNGKSYKTIERFTIAQKDDESMGGMFDVLGESKQPENSKKH